MVGKQAIQAISERQNKATTLKESVITAAEDYNLVTKEIYRTEKDKAVKATEKQEQTKIDVQDLKNAEKLVLDIEEGR